MLRIAIRKAACYDAHLPVAPGTAQDVDPEQLGIGECGTPMEGSPAGICPENRPKLAHRRAGIRVHEGHASEMLRRPARLRRPGGTPIRRSENRPEATHRRA